MTTNETPITWDYNFRLEGIPASSLSAIDLKETVVAAKDADVDVEAYRFSFHYGPDHERLATGEMLYIPKWFRAGIYTGADSDWTDCDTALDAAERYLGLNGKEMDN